jgi:triosephosphate isomerase
MRKKLIAGNWKMNKTISESYDLILNLKKLISPEVLKKVDVLICPPFVNLNAANDILENSGISTGGQNVHYKDEGAFTGEISAKMLKSVGCNYVIIGHSERRQYFFETNDIINLKIKKALENELIPILCVGETLEQREANIHIKIVDEQVTLCLKGLSDEEIRKIVIAYEPVWAIGTGKTASREQANEMHILIRKSVSNLFANEIANNIIILYGGSMNDKNSKELLSMSDIDGGLIGGASLIAESFVNIVNSAI